MNSPLSLTIDQSVIERAEQYAQSRGLNLSGLVEEYLRNLINEPEETAEFSPLIQSLMGSVQLDDRDCKEIYREEILKRYL